MASLKDPRSYEEDFDSDWYLSVIYGSVEGNHEKVIKFCLDFFHKTFASGTVYGERLLDIGTGPTVHSVISASPHVTEIHLSDFAEKNRKILKNWLNGGSNVNAYFQYFLKMEDKGEVVETRNKTMREKVKKIFSIDLLQDKPIADLDCKYDVITTSLCLEAAARKKEEYRDIVCKIAEMLNPGGHLAMVGVLGESFYVVGEFRFPCLKLTEMDVKTNLIEAGFSIKEWSVFNDKDVIRKETEELADLEELFVVLAQKK